MDRVVSSYSPTIRALIRARRDRKHPEPNTSAVIVAVPEAPGAPPLRHALDEAEDVVSLLTGAHVLRSPTRDAVLDALGTSAIAHLICHGAHHPGDPSRSLLVLSDHDSAPFDVAALGSLRLSHARLAYLSACETALITTNGLLDESIHLASAFLLAGYPSVVGTLWRVDDQVAAELAAAFNRELTDNGAHVPDTDRAALALHHATRALRDAHPATSCLWASHLHVGR